MSDKRKIQEAIQRISGTYKNDPVQFIICSVDSFDLETQTCDCTPIGGDATTTIPNVSLKAEPNNGILIKPKIDSVVLVAMSLKTSAYIFMFSDIDSIETIIKGPGNPTKLKIEDGKITMNDGSFGGLVKIEDPNDITSGLLKKLNNLEDKVNLMITIFNAHVHPGVTVGVASTLISVTPVVGTLTPTVKADVENGLIVHGQ